jgi:hypothetical protein
MQDLNASGFERELTEDPEIANFTMGREKGNGHAAVLMQICFEFYFSFVFEQLGKSKRGTDKSMKVESIPETAC